MTLAPVMEAPAKLVYIADAARHLVCLPYSVENLHRMAEELGLSRRWFHAGRHPHYDIPKREASRIGAIAVPTTSRVVLAVTKGVYTRIEEVRPSIGELAESVLAAKSTEQALIDGRLLAERVSELLKKTFASLQEESMGECDDRE